MKGMPLPFDFQGKGVLDLDFVVKNKDFIADFVRKDCFLSGGFGEPTSVLDSARIPSRPTSSSTLSSSLGAGGSTGAGGGGAASTDTAGVAAVSDSKWHHDSTNATRSNAGGADSELLPVPPSLEIGAAAAGGGGGDGNPEKFAMEDWESVLSDSAAASPSQEQAFLRWVMGDVENPGGGGAATAAAEFDFAGGFGVVDQGFGGEQFGSTFMPTLPNFPNRSAAEKIGLPFSQISSNVFKFSPNSQNFHHQPPFDSSAEMKPPIFNPPLLINQHQTQLPHNPSFFFPSEQSFIGPPQAKRHNSGGPGPFTDTGQQEMMMGRQQLQLLPHYLQQRPMGQKPKIGGGAAADDCHQLQQQAIVDQLYKAAELVQTGNPLLAQGILARLNHQLSPIGKPFNRAAFYCKEALQLLLHTNNNDVNPSAAAAASSPFSLVFKIGAYKSFSEISPLVQFANFTCNQAILEVLDGFDRIHIVDFDIGYGGQWASLMQELALRGGGAPSLKITALASSSSHDQLELGLTRENLIQFASEINITFEFEAISIDSSNSVPFHVQENEGVAVNLPVGSLANHQLSVPLILRLVKQLSPRIVVSVDRGCDRTDLPFANHIVHALQSYSNLLESLDAVNVNMDALQKIERFLLQPGIEKIVMGRVRSPEKTQHWRALFLSSGFSPITFSNFTESQAECVIKRTPVRGFQVEKRQSSLVLCWQRKELISATAWRC